MSISIICAMTKDRVIGHGSEIPWKIPSDFKNFKKITSGHTVVMGRLTFESIGKPLPNRRNIVITSDLNYTNKHEDIIVASSPQEAMDMFNPNEESFIIGGSTIYKYFFPYVSKFYISLVHYFDKKIYGDVFFPDYTFDNFNILEKREVSEIKDSNDYTFTIYERGDIL